MKSILLNPFRKVAGIKALLIGMACMGISAMLAVHFKARFDGVLDLHFSTTKHYLAPFTDHLQNWLVLSFMSGLIAFISGARPRVIDVLGTMAMARAPFILAPLLNLTGSMSRLAEGLEAGRQEDLSGILENEMLPLIFLGALAIVAVVWSVIWYYNAYKTFTNLKGNKLVLSFTAMIILSEVLSVYLIRVVFNQYI